MLPKRSLRTMRIAATAGNIIFRGDADFDNRYAKEGDGS